MHVERKLTQHRRDFTAIYKCEHCNATKKASGYDDAHFHETVVPDMKCENCGKKASGRVPTLKPVHPSHVQL